MKDPEKDIDSHEKDLTVDLRGHGTFCAGILLHAKNVVKIMNLKVGLSILTFQDHTQRYVLTKMFVFQ